MAGQRRDNLVGDGFDIKRQARFVEVVRQTLAVVSERVD